LPNAAAASGDPGTQTLQLREAIAAQGIALDDVDDLGGALGTSAGGRIQIVKGLPPAGEFLVLVHELAHLCTAGGYVLLRDATTMGPRQASRSFVT
jgi:hypothetical protein